MTDEIRLYGVSTGDGNMGVSHMYADYYVRTNDPWLLARAAAYDWHKREIWGFLDEGLNVDGEADYTISADVYQYPCDSETEECEACGGEGILDDEECDDCEGTGTVEVEEDWDGCDHSEFILHVFPENDDEWAACRTCPVYDCIEDALSEDAIAHVRKLEGV